MKYWILTLAMLSATIANAGEGSGVGNGGDPYEQEFATVTQSAMAALAPQLSQIPYVSWAKMKELIGTVEVKFTDESLYNFSGVQKACINIAPENLIKCNRKMWESAGSIKRKMALALHEYFGLAGYEVNNYRLSGWVFAMNPTEVEFGRIGSIQTGATYQVDGKIRTAKDALTPLTAELSVDHEYNRIILSFFYKNTGWGNLTFNCSSGAAQDCEAAAGPLWLIGSIHNFESYGDSSQNTKLTVTVLPGRQLLLRGYALKYRTGWVETLTEKWKPTN